MLHVDLSVKMVGDEFCIVGDEACIFGEESKKVGVVVVRVRNSIINI